MSLDEVTSLIAWLEIAADQSTTLKIVGKVVAQKPCYTAKAERIADDPLQPYYYNIKVTTEPTDAELCPSVLTSIEFKMEERNYTGSHADVLAHSGPFLEPTEIRPVQSEVVQPLPENWGKTISLNEIIEAPYYWRPEVEKDVGSNRVEQDDAVFSFFPIEVGDAIDNLGIMYRTLDPKAKNDRRLKETFFVSGRAGERVRNIAERVVNTGGHYHGGASQNPRAAGMFDQRTITLGDNYPQNHPVIWTAPDVSGKIILGGLFEYSNPPFIGYVAELSLNPPLVPVPNSQKLRLKPPTQTHRSPYWVSSDVANKLAALAEGYHARTGKHLTVTDASLQTGGRFDYKPSVRPWVPPHAEHMFGNEVDMRSRDQDETQRTIFKEECVKVGLSPADHGNHWHVRA